MKFTTFAVLFAISNLTLAVPARADETVSYAYDGLGRLATATYANGAIITYSYDNYDNKTSTVTSCPNSGC